MNHYFENINSLLAFDDFDIIRNGVSIGTVKGFFTSSKYPNSIQTMQNFKLQVYDELYHIATDTKYTIYQLKPLSSNNHLDGYIATYKEDKSTHTSVSYNIENVSGNSAIGQNAAVNNFGFNFDDLIKIISSEIKDDQISKELIHELESIKSSEEPIQKGKLAKFSDLIKKHENLVIPLGNFLVKLLLGDSMI